MGDTNSEEPSTMEKSEVWPTSITDTIPVDLDVDEVSTEEMLRSYHLQFSDIPDPYPAIPHFGVLYLSIPRAVSLIVCDLFI
jgi:hypothetical protein